MLTIFAALIEPLMECEYSADRLQGGRSLVLALGGPVDEIERHCRSLQPLRTIINGPNGVGLRKLIDECLNEWILIRHFAGIASICALDKSENRSLRRFGVSRYQTASFTQGVHSGSDV